jgi:hypothetical protein
MLDELSFGFLTLGACDTAPSAVPRSCDAGEPWRSELHDWVCGLFYYTKPKLP